MTNEDVKILRMISGNCNLEKTQRDMLKRIADREEPEFKLELTEETKTAKELMETVRIDPVEEGLKVSFEQQIAFEVDNAITEFIEERIREGFPFLRTYAFNTNNIADAIRKQIPKKPKTWMRGYECGACGMRRADMMREMKYCPNCGQKIDWGEIK